MSKEIVRRRRRSISAGRGGGSSFRAIAGPEAGRYRLTFTVSADDTSGPLIGGDPRATDSCAAAPALELSEKPSMTFKTSVSNVEMMLVARLNPQEFPGPENRCHMS